MQNPVKTTLCLCVCYMQLLFYMYMCVNLQLRFTAVYFQPVCFLFRLQSCVYGENRTSIQCTTPSLAKLALPPPVVTKVAFVLDGYYTDQWDLIYVEDPLFQDPKLTSKDNKSIVELKVREPQQ